MFPDSQGFSPHSSTFVTPTLARPVQPASAAESYKMEQYPFAVLIGGRPADHTPHVRNLKTPAFGWALLKDFRAVSRRSGPCAYWHWKSACALAGLAPHQRPRGTSAKIGIPQRDNGLPALPARQATSPPTFSYPCHRHSVADAETDKHLSHLPTPRCFHFRPR